MLGPGAIPHAAPSVQPSYGSVLGRAAVSLLATPYCPWGTEKWVAADVSMVKSPRSWVVQGCPLTSCPRALPRQFPLGNINVEMLKQMLGI